MAHDHHHPDHGQEPPGDLALRVKALETLLVDKGLVDPAALDAIIETYEHKVGPRNGARVVARHDFIEGVRAVIVDKDNAPRWSPATIDGVSEAMLDEIFAPLPADQEWSPLA